MFRLVPTGKRQRFKLPISFGYPGAIETRFTYGLGGEAYMPTPPGPYESTYSTAHQTSALGH